MIFTCLYCEEKLFAASSSNANTLFECERHNNKVRFILINSLLYRTQISNTRFEINIFHPSNIDDKIFMRIFKKTLKQGLYVYHFIGDFPIDKHMTPENFEERINNYLLFI